MAETATRTILFADIVGSTRIYARLGDAAAYAWLSRVLGTLDAGAQRHGGTVVKHMGDAVLAVFAAPDAALAASSTLHAAAADAEIALRIGVQAGPVTLATDGDIHGDAVNVAARLHDLAAPHETLVGDGVSTRLPEPARARLRHMDDRVLAGRGTALGIYQCLEPGMAHGVTSLADRPVKPRRGPPAWRLAHGSATWPVPVEPAQLMVGRSRDCDVVVAAPFASRQHVALAATDRGVAVADMSTNGTYLCEAGGRERFLHRERVVLAGVATLGLGEALAGAEPAAQLHLVPAAPDSDAVA